MKRIRLAQRRRVVGLSQEAFAEQLGVDVSTVRRWEYGEREPQPWHRPNLAAVLRVTLEELDDLLVLGDYPQPRQALALPAIHYGQAENPANDLATMQSLRLADRQVGGGQLYATVTGYLQHTLAPRLFGIQPTADNSRIFAAAATLTDMAGWMAHDAGRDDTAEGHFQRALGLATAASDPQLEGNILASLSHLAFARQQPAKAVLHARQGRERLGQRHATCVTAARLSTMEARGHAVMGNAGACTDHLRLAEAALQAEPGESRSPWVSDFDQAALAAEAARCFRDLGQLDSARRSAEQVVSLRSTDRPRSRAYAQLLLASVLIGQWKIEEAAMNGREALEATRTVSSFPVLEQLVELGISLAGHRKNRHVAAFLELLRQELANRRATTGSRQLVA
jgi:transcriptional regulator with XRE-family HTH domain